MSEFPLVSCVMPTRDRALWAGAATAMFFHQDYRNKELVVYDTGEFQIPDIGIAGVRVIRGNPDRGITLGRIRNQVNQLSFGELICHWDDDDFYTPDRISRQVAALRDNDICGLDSHYFYDPAKSKAWFYSYPREQRPWLAGGTCLYRRSLWERCPFPDVQVGSDTQWIWSLPRANMVIMDNETWYVARIHAGNTSPKIIQEREWKEVPVAEAFASFCDVFGQAVMAKAIEKKQWA